VREAKSPTTAFATACGADKLPTTSQPSIGDFDAYRPPLAAGHDIVSVRISGRWGLSNPLGRQRSSSGTTPSCHGDRPERMWRAGADQRRRAKAASWGRWREVQRRAGRRALTSRCGSRSIRSENCAGAAGLSSVGVARDGAQDLPILTMDQEITPVERVRTSARAVRRLTEYAGNAGVTGRRLGGPASGAW
jgi:hypothetical protein